MPVTLEFPPRLMPAPQAAHFLGVSQSKLLTLDLPRRLLGSKRLYHINDLIAYADGLPVEGSEGENSCDGLFGASA